MKDRVLLWTVDTNMQAQSWVHVDCGKTPNKLIVCLIIQSAKQVLSVPMLNMMMHY